MCNCWIMKHFYPFSKFRKVFPVIILFIGFQLSAYGQCPPVITPSNNGDNTTIINGNNVSSCPGTNVLLTVSPSTGVTYQWYYNAVPIDTLPPSAGSINVQTPGLYTVAVSDCPLTSNTINLTNFTLPTVSISFSSNPVCSGEDVAVSLSSSPSLSSNDSWFWLQPTEIVGEDSSFVGEFYNTTTFSAVVVTNNGCAKTQNQTLIVHQPINPGQIVSDQDICSGETPTELSGPAATGGDPSSYFYQWQYSTDDGTTWVNIPGATGLAYQPPALTQTTLYRRIVFNSSPCPAVTQYDPVTITVYPIPTVTSATAISICSGESVNYTPTSGVNGTTFTWTGSVTSGSVSGVTASGTGAITDILTLPAGGTTSGIVTYTITPIGPEPTYCEGTPVDLIVTVLPLPVPTITGPSDVCYGSTGNIYTTEAGMSDYTWTIQGGSITSGQGTNEITVTWNTVGTQWVRVTYTGLNGCEAASATQYNVTVNPLPVPTISGPSTPCEGDPGNIYTTETGMTNYVWNVSSGGTITGGGSASDNNITITWNTTGVQWVSVTYTDVNGCTNTTPTQFFVNVSTPTLTGPTSPCLGSSTNVYTTDPGNTDYVWTVTPGGTIVSGGTSTDYTATIQWNIVGSQEVTVNYTSSSGCSSSSPASVTVNVLPLPAPTLSGDNDVCAEETGLVYTTESGKSLYDWSVSSGGSITSGGTTLSNTATVTWNTAGTQYVYVNYTDANGCSAESPIEFPVTVNPLPVPTITGSTSECDGSSGVVYYTESGQSGYSWTITGGSITSGAGTNTITVTWNTPGVQTLTVDYTDSNGCSASVPTELSVTVLPLPVPSVSGYSSVCVNATNVEYSTEAGMTNYQWTVSSGGSFVGSSTNQTVYVNWNTVGNQYLTVTYTGSNGCDAAVPTTYNVTVNDLPSPTITGDAEVCNNSTGNVYTTQPGMSNYDWVVTGGAITSGGSATDNTVTVTWNTVGNQSVSVNYEQTGCPATSPYVLAVVVNPLPTVNAGTNQSIPNGTNTTLTGTASGGTGALAYLWTPVDMIQSGGTSLTPVTENIFSDQTFTLTVTDTKLCSASDDMDVIVLGDALSVIATASPDAICNNGASVQLNATAAGGNSAVQQDFSWTSTPAGFTSVLQNPVVTPTQTTTYHVSVYDGYNTASHSVVVTVNPLPTIYTVTGGGEYCAGGSGVTVGLDGSQSGVSYQLMLDGSDYGSPRAGTGSALSFTNCTGEGTYTARAVNTTTTCENNMAGSVDVSINPLPVVSAGTDQSIPYGTSTSLSATASGGTGSLTYLWSPAGMIASGGTTLTPATENIYTDQTYTFAVTDTKSCVSTDDVVVSLLGGALAVTATATPDAICNNGSSSQLNATATGGNSATQQDFQWTSTPGSFTSTLQNPVVSPTTTTTYNVEVFDGFNTSTSSVIVTVNPLPILFTVTGGGEYCSGDAGVTVGLDGSETGISYQLYLDGVADGSPLPGTGSALSYGNKTAEGIYTVGAMNVATGCERDMTGSVEVIINPLPVASAGVDQTIFHGTSTTLAGSASGGTTPLSYLWTPAGMIAAGATTLAPVTTNIYSDQTYTLTVTDVKGCVDADAMQVIIDGTALSVVADVTPGVICDGNPAQLTATGAGGSGTYNYSWVSVPGSWTSTEQNPVVTPSVTTQYTVTVDDGYNTATSSVTVTVNPVPVAYNVTGGGDYCSGGDGVEIGLDDSETGVNYQLYYEGSPTGTTVSGNGGPVSFGNQMLAGEYTVIGTVVTSSCYYQMTGTAEVIINPLPTVYNMTGGGSYPAGGIGMVVGLSDSDIGIYYRLMNYSDTLTPEPGVAGNGSPFEFGLQTLAGPYTAYAINSVTGCVSNMNDTSWVTINPYPGIFNVYGGDTICSDGSAEIGIDGSEIGVEYSLIRDGFSIMSGIAGTGDSIIFGDFNVSGDYTVLGTNIATGLQEYMAGTAVVLVETAPLIYSLSFVQPGDNCLPVVPILSGSQTGVNYYINYLDSSGYYVPGIDTVIGTGGMLTFDTLYYPGIYTATAMIDHGYIQCYRDMNGSINAVSPPLEFEISPHGTICEDSEVLCILETEPSVVYTLWLNSQPTTNSSAGDPAGGAICFDTLTAPGTYRVYALDTVTGCEIFFDEHLEINPSPIVYLMSPTEGCTGTVITLNGCQEGIDYYLYFDPPSKDMIQISGPFNCESGSISFGPLDDEGVYRVKAVDTLTNCEVWMQDSTMIYPSPEVFAISPQGGGCAPVEIYMSNFEIDVTYYLYRDDIFIATDDGTDGEVNFGPQSVPGTYTVSGLMEHSGHVSCWSDMSGDVHVYNAMVEFTLMPGDTVCPGETLYLSGSEAGVSYMLWNNDAGFLDTIIGTGGIISFGSQELPGQYWVIAESGQTCQLTMNGITTIDNLPQDFSMTPVGQFCSNDTVTIGMDSTEVGVVYQLFKSNSASNPQAEITGDGNPMTFGDFTQIGTYWVVAVGSGGCESNMSGELIINQAPNVYNVTANDSLVHPGWYCPPVDIGLNMSQAGIRYTLTAPDGTQTILYGDGSPLDFGSFELTGTYDVVALDTATFCSIDMTGTVSIFEQPEVYELSCLTNPPVFCEGNIESVRLMLNYSQLDIDYQLYRDGIAVGPPKAGTNNFIIWDSVSQYGGGIYTVEAEFVINPYCSLEMDGSVELTEIPLPTAELSGVDSICENIYCTDMTVMLTGTQEVELVYTNGTSNFTHILDPTIPEHIIEVCQTESTTYSLVSVTYTESPYCEGALTGTFRVEVVPLPEAIAGDDGATCVSVPYTLSDASASSYSSVEWTILSGNGSLDDSSLLNPVYMPVLSDEGTTVDLMMVVTGLAGCSAETDTSWVSIDIDPLPVAYAGADEDACVSVAQIDFTDASAQNASSVLWTHDGFGIISDPDIVNTSYTPDPADAGSTVTFTLTVYGMGECAAMDSVSVKTVTFDSLPEVDAGTGGEICELDTITLSGTASNYSSVLWTVETGSGVFSDASNLVTDFHPGNVDIATDMILTLTAYGTGECAADSATSIVIVTVYPAPEVYAGPDDSICNTDPYQLAYATADNALSITWTTDGAGTFGNSGELNTTYYPDASDLTAGSVTLFLQGVSENAFCSNAIDSMVLVLSEPPVAEFSFNTPGCANETVYFTDETVPVDSPVVSFTWDFGDGSPLVVINNASGDTSHVYSIGGDYIVQLVAVNLYGCPDTVEHTISVPDPVNMDFVVSDDTVCLGDAITFTQSGTAVLSNWQWDFGDGNTSTVAEPAHTYAASGTYDVWFTFTDDGGCSDSVTHQVTVSDLPEADFTVDMSNACTNSSVLFNATGSSDIESWQWDFGDGQTGSGQNVTHFYTTWGHFNITLTVTNTMGCVAVMEDSIYLTTPPDADFTYEIALCDSIQFTDLSTCDPGYNLVSWFWDFGDGTTDTLQNPSHNYPSNTIPGGETYMVSLIVGADSLGFICYDSIVLPVNVPSLPDVYLTWDDPVCFGDSVNFYGESGFPIETWHWDFGDGHFSNLQYPAHMYADTGTYNVILEVVDTNGCINNISEVVTIKPVPEVSFTMSDSVVCKGSPVYFTATGSANVDEWYWEFGDGGISYQQNPIHYYPSGNTYTVTLIVTDSTGCSATETDEIRVLPGPTADFSYSNVSCTSVAFADESEIPSGYFATEFFWDFGDGFTSDLQNPVHSYTTGISTYDVMFVVTADSSGYSCSDTTYQTIYTSGLPSVFFTWDPEPTMLGNTTNFYGNSGNTITNWNWDFHDGTTSTDQNPAHVFPTVGTFNVELTVTDIEGCENTVTHLVTVVNIPDLDYEWSYACLGEQIQFTILDPPTDIGAVTSWDWDFGDGSTSSDMEPIHTYAASGTYNVSCSIVDTMGATNTVIKQLTVNPLPNSLFNIGTQVCANNPVEFFDHSTTQTGYITEWFWEFGDGSDTTVYFGGDPDVTHIYSGTSTYTVTLTVTNSDSCSNSSTHTVTTEPGPIALFDYNSGCASGPVSFTDESTINGGGEIVTWLWDFGDPGSGASNTSTLQNPVHLFSAPGDYTVLLMVANINGCEDTVSHTVTVSEEPEVDFTWEANCLTEETQFTVDESVTNVGEVATWSWSFGDGGTSNLQNPTHTYEVAGTFDVILSIETTDGCFASVTHSVDINPLPTANFAHTGPSCLNDTVYFSNLSSSPNGLIETWVWDFGDGNEITINAPDNPNVEHMYTNEGTFDVVLTVTDAEGCENNVTKQVVIVSSPIADFNWDAGCLNEPVQFTDISSTNGGPDIGQWEWYFGDPASGTNNTSNLPNPTHVFSTDSTFTVTLIIHNTMGCTDTVEHEIVITALPDVDFTIENDTICLGSLAQFTGISNSEIATWYWQFGDGGTSIEQNPGYGYQQAGTYTVTLTVTDVSGCENSTSQEVHVNYAPEALFSYDNACLGDSTSFTDFSYTNNGYINNWSWDFGDGNTSDETDPVHTYTTNDTYYVTLIVWDNSGCSDSITLPVQVFDVPVPAFNFAQACDPPGQVNFFNESVMGSDNSPITGYEWHLDDGYYSDEVDPSYIYEITDTCYQVTLTAFNNNGCSATDTMEVCVFGAIETSFEATDVCLGQPTEFQAFYGPENDSVANYLWNFHDGSQTELTYHDTISHTFPAPGIYLVELIATDTNDCQAIYTSEITIDSLPVASFTNTIGGCEIPTYFEGVTYSGGEFIESWYWDFGDTTSTNNTDSIWNPTHLYGPNDSTYLVQLIVTNYNGCIDTVVQEVYVAPCITAGFKVPDEPICARNELFFVDTSFLASNNGMIGTWLWDFGDGTTETYDVFTDTVWHTYADAGTYELSLTITAGIDTNSYTTTTMVEFEVHPTPLPMIGLENNCQRDTTYYSDNSTIFGEPTTYRLWNFGDPTTEADTSNVQDPKYVYPTFESYPVSLFVQNRFMCADSTKDTITIYKLPVAQFTYQNTCMSYYTQFEETSIADSAVIASWFWNFGDTLKAPADTAIIQAPQYIYDSAGMYTVEMIITDEHLCMDTASAEIEIIPKPISEFVIIDTNRQGQVYFDNLSTNNPVDYEWDFDYNQGIWTSNDVNPIFQYEEDGNYTIMLVSWNQQGCPDTTYQVYNLLFTNLFVPNTFVPSSPITDLQTFKPVGINLSSYKLEVYSAWGNLVFETTELIDGVPSEGWDGTYEGEPLPTGSYIWRIEAVFEDGSHWRGTDNGDGNTGTSGTIMLVR